MPQIPDLKDLGASVYQAYYFSRKTRSPGQPDEKHLTCAPDMAPNDSAGADDFVIIENPLRTLTLQGGLGEYPIESGYVKVRIHDPTSAAKQATLAMPTQVPTPAPAQVEHQQPTVEYKQQPIVEHKQPVVEHKQQYMDAKQQYMVAKQQHFVEKQQPIVENQQYVVEHQQSVVAHNERMVEILNFCPMPLSAFPEELLCTLINKHAPDDNVNGPACPVHPDWVLIKNCIVIMDCLFHFEDICSKIGRDNLLYVVGKACELSCEDDACLVQCVSRTVGTLADARAKYIREGNVNKVAEYPDVGILACYLERYIKFELHEPQTIDDNWYKDPDLTRLWSSWQKILKEKRQVATNGQKKTAAPQNTDNGSERSYLIADAVQAVAKLGDALTQLGIDGGSGELSPSERLLIEQLTLGAKRLKAEVDQFKSY